MSENLRTFVKALYGFDAVVSRVPATAWSNESPCEGWTATDVVAHNIGMNHMITGFTNAVDAVGPAHDAVIDAPTAWGESLDTVLAAIDSKGALQVEASTPWGDMPVDTFLGFAWVDPLTHTWDLACATGQDAALDSLLCGRGLAQLERAGDSLRGSGAFGPAVEVADDASVVDRFIAITGRDPVR